MNNEILDMLERLRDKLCWHFTVEWERLAELGACERHSGGEWERVYRLWVQLDYPASIEVFIRGHATPPPPVNGDPAGAPRTKGEGDNGDG